jgi:SAM-dependent methyltransferase
MDDRTIPRPDAKNLPAGAAHYSAYVGPPDQFDFMGATQFRLLTTLGLRETHKVLDFGCGSLRAGRFLLPYLLPDNYYGIEPNVWLIEDAIRYEVGHDQIALKRPSFSHNTDFRIDHFNAKFDFIIAQSIFSHSGKDLVKTALANFRDGLAPNGLILATFIHVGMSGLDTEYEGEGWFYPGCVAYKPETVARLIAEAHLEGMALPWFHPRQCWYALAVSRADLPATDQFPYLSGAILRSPEFSASTPLA